MAGNMTCTQCTAAFSPYLLKTLSAPAHRRMEAHLRQCATCREALTEARARLSILDALPPSIAPEGLAERTIARIEGATTVERPQTQRWVLAGASALTVLLVVAALLPVLSRTREAARRSSTQGNMKELGIVFKMYANESKGDLWPQLAMNTNAWVPELSVLREKFLSNPDCLVSEQHPDAEQLKRALHAAWVSPEADLSDAERIMGESFGYMGYLFEDQDDFEAALHGESTPETSPKPLRDGIERFLITDINNPAGTAAAQSNIPVLVEIATWKYKKSVEDYPGANVLYMDGHVEFVPLGTFPVVPSVLNTLSGIEAEQ